MKTKKRIFLLAFSTLIFGSVHVLNAQVTIGSEQEPNVGALLDLKENADGTSSKGFNLPRVALTSLTSLAPCYTGADADVILSHKGLMVYNTTNSENIKPGVLHWNGSSWINSADELMYQKTKIYDWPAEITTVTDEAKKIVTINIPVDGTYLIVCHATVLYGVAAGGFPGFYHITLNNESIAHEWVTIPASDVGQMWNVSIVRTLTAGSYDIGVVSYHLNSTFHPSNSYIAISKLP